MLYFSVSKTFVQANNQSNYWQLTTTSKANDQGCSQEFTRGTNQEFWGTEVPSGVQGQNMYNPRDLRMHALMPHLATPLQTINAYRKRIKYAHISLVPGSEATHHKYRRKHVQQRMFYAHLCDFYEF